MFDGYIRDHARWTPRAPAVVTPAGAISYARFDADVERVAGHLARQGVSPASGVVAIAVDHAYIHLAAMAALARLGVASAPAADPGADLALTDLGPDPLAGEPRAAPVLRLDLDAIGRVMLSSGTTAVPKRVGMSWRRIEIGNHATLRTYGAGRTGAYIPVTGVDTLLGFGQVICAWSCGAAVAAGFGLSDLPVALETLPAGVVGLTPRHLRALLDLLPPGFRPQPQWRLCVAGALLPLPLAREAMARLTPDVRIIYGSTECSLIAVGHAAGLEDHPGQVGITPAGALVELVDDQGRPVPEGDVGEIRITAERMTQGYLDDPAATAERFRDGWFHTRDLGRRLPDGRLVLEGRADDRLNLAGGGKLMPQAIEAAAFAFDGVTDCAAFAVPDPADGFDRCWLAVVAAPSLDRDALADHLARRPDLPPPRLAWIDEIPRNAMGKVERSKLRDLLLAALDSR